MRPSRYIGQALIFTCCLFLACCVLATRCATSQEASSGLDLHATLTGQAVASNLLTDPPRSGAPMIAGFHGVLYPTWKMNDNWFVSGALQLATRPFYYQDLSSTGYGAKGAVMQAALNYAKVWNSGSMLLRAGELPTAFGAFPLRYDDAVNFLVDLPVPYAYYYAPVCIVPLAGAQMDVTAGKWDGRLQFANSSPANPRKPWVKDQYGNWAGGAGYTIRQGFRVGVSAYRGPYLDRDDPGATVLPSNWIAQAYGVDANWIHGHTSVNAELEHFIQPAPDMATTRETAGYAELKQVLTPRWFIAGRYGETSVNTAGSTRVVETGAAFRPNRLQLIKVSYEMMYASSPGYYSGSYPASSSYDHIVGIQLVTTLHAAIAGR